MQEMAQVIHQLTITGPQMQRVFVLPLGATTVGRNQGNNLVLTHPLVSRRHARLDRTDGECRITDLGSTHGTRVNRRQLTAQNSHLLNPGDVIEIGAFRLLFEHVTEAEYMSAPAVDPDLAALEVHLAAGRAALSPKPDTNGKFSLPPGLSMNDSSYLAYLPDIYQGNPNGFIPRFLAMLESILAPIEWNINNFDLYLDPETAPVSFLPWLANWYELTFDDSWTEESQRTLMREAHQIYRRRGTHWALTRLLEIYTGVTPEIEDQAKDLDPFTFTVRIPLSSQQVSQTVIEQLIDTSKPAHTSYKLLFNE